MAIAFAAVGATAALSLATAGAATASPAGHPKPTPQVRGSRLEQAQAATTVFGQEYATYGARSDLTETFLDGSTEELANENNGTNDPVSTDLPNKLINRTQALYPRH